NFEKPPVWRLPLTHTSFLDAYICSEEYRLWKSDDKIVDKTTWILWEDGMRDLMGSHPDYRVIWNDSKVNYISIADTDHNDFYYFFNNLVEVSTHFERNE
ncbi:MAG: hypothetical protein K2J46_04870, partial [Muribaculaceae bacterium]|nr:hypothetical protein [Muribaculaceae bacterium]